MDFFSDDKALFKAYEQVLVQEASESRINFLSQQFGIPVDKVKEIAQYDPSNGKYLGWILKMARAKILKFPEDGSKTIERLTQFQALSRKPNFQGERDVNKYASYGDLAQAIRDNEGVQTKGEAVRAAQTEGAKLLNSRGDLSLYKVTTPEAAAKLFRHTEWCVKDPKFFHRYGPPFYYLEKDGAPYKLLHLGSEYSTPEDPDEEQPPSVMNVNDKPTSFDEYRDLGLNIGPLLQDPDFIVRYAFTIAKERIPEAEPYILQNPMRAAQYADMVIKGRWPEAEPIIREDVTEAINYAYRVIKGRWSDAEPYIMKSNSAAYYAANIIKGRWPEAEPYILKDPDHAIRYAEGVIKGRWPEAEPIIMKAASTAYLYALNVIRGRWPEAEPIIMRDPAYAKGYAEFIIKDRWPEAEPYIMHNPVAAAMYARNVIKGRWKEAEPIIDKNERAYKEYYKFLQTNRLI